MNVIQVTEWTMSSGLWVFAGTRDRYCTEGYGPQLSAEEAIDRAGEVDDLEGIEITYPSMINEENLDLIKTKLEENDLEVTSVNLGLWGKSEWKHGAFTNEDNEIREKAIQIGKKAISIAKKLNCNTIGIWPGQDGYDYPFQVDYETLWQREIMGIEKIAESDKDMKIGLEYKYKEPRNRILVGSVGKTLLLIEEIGLENVGVVLDSGHALMNNENLGESVQLISNFDRLFNIHVNDNYREDDDDMIVGTINLWETLELVYYLKKVDYEGPIALDIYPYREDPVEAADLSIKNLKSIIEVSNEINPARLEEIQESQGPIASLKFIQGLFFE